MSLNVFDIIEIKKQLSKKRPRKCWSVSNTVNNLFIFIIITLNIQQSFARRPKKDLQNRVF